MAEKSVFQQLLDVQVRFEAQDIRIAELESDFAELSEKYGTLSRQVASPSGIEVPKTPRPGCFKKIGL